MKIWLDGKLVEQEEAKTSVFDHGTLYGDGIFAVSYTHLTLPTKA